MSREGEIQKQPSGSGGNTNNGEQTKELISPESNNVRQPYSNSHHHLFVYRRPFEVPPNTAASRQSRRPIVEVRRVKGKGKEKVQAKAASRDPNDSSDEEDDNEDDRSPCEQCRVKKISSQRQAGKRSSIICKPCHGAKVRCSFSGHPSTVKKEVNSHPTGKQLAVLESQMAQLLADNQQLCEGQVKANTYHWHFNKKLDWLMMDAARQRRLPPKMPEAGPLQLPRKRRRVVDSEEEEEEEEEQEREVERDGEGEEEEEQECGEAAEDEPAPKKAQSEKGKEREE
ncbi:hypothetical protein EV359DRAFT_87736 [Lentinula novae-zelandiae]|nr:hypothetical protein EV359DRAFT_87736 [Lentinula novae-zelandiae]